MRIISEIFFFFQAEDGIRDRSPSRGLGDVYKRQVDDLDLQFVTLRDCLEPNNACSL